MLTDFNRPRGSISPILQNGISVDQFYNSMAVDSYASLKTIIPTFEGQRALLLSHQKDKNLGGGLFIARSGAATDDGGYTAVVNSNWYWERSSNTGHVNVTEFGLVDGGALDTPLDNAIKFAIAKKKNFVEVPGLGPLGYNFSGGLSYPCNGINLTIQGPGCSTNLYSGYNSGFIKYSGTGYGIKFYQDAPIRMFNTVKVSGFSANSTLSASDSNKTIDFCFFYFSDAWNFTVTDCFLRNFDNGSGIIIENDRSWTENFTCDNVQVRTSTRGWWFRRSSRSGNTNSFYGTKVTNCYFSHDSNVGSSNAVVLGGTGNATVTLNPNVNVYASYFEMGGWASSGGDNSVFQINDQSCLNEGQVRLNYDGLWTMPLNTISQPIRAFIQRGTGYVKVNFVNNSTQADYPDISALIASGGAVTVYPYSAFGEKRTSQTAQRTYPSSADPIKLLGSRIGFKANVVKGMDSTIRVRLLPLYSKFRITIATNWNTRACSTWIFSTHGSITAGSLKREDINPLVTVASTSNSTSTVNGDSTVSTVTTTNSVATVADDRSSINLYPRLSGGLTNFAGTTTYWSEFEIFVGGSAISGSTQIDFVVTIEMIE